MQLTQKPNRTLLEKDETIEEENPISEKTPDELMEIGFKQINGRIK
ncbi:MAG: hypothetical protein K8F52_17205 [Candidatus Scalindua rubra]|uniref:Uncharacterized protein n=1 Tax=Candidatus Scalindua brodae TaxID=237368 RepID=A0A0B0EIW9_9BACT|nr:MAG: hypothetical protein SCABRO_01386 [Candidatus Scalindua brodae]MBZ0110391.1 hypothetical protein [Candidatus Scalindua rubra]TWU36223.1 hypothetical protein S225a_05020 [Candidatus Brocadiaceae bacterium S225]